MKNRKERKKERLVEGDDKGREFQLGGRRSLEKGKGGKVEISERVAEEKEMRRKDE